MRRITGWGLASSVTMVVLAGCGTPRAVEDLPPLPAESLNAVGSAATAAAAEAPARPTESEAPQAPPTAPDTARSGVANEQTAPVGSGSDSHE